MRSKRHVRRPSVQAETKYIELMVVNDYELVGPSSPHPPLPLLKCVYVCLCLQACALHLCFECGRVCLCERTCMCESLFLVTMVSSYPQYVLSPNMLFLPGIIKCHLICSSPAQYVVFTTSLSH